MLDAVNNFKNCLNMKCKNEEDQFKKNKYSIQIEKLKQDLHLRTFKTPILKLHLHQ